MLAPKVNKKKNLINILVLVGILLVILIVVYQNFFAGKIGAGDETVSPVISGLDTIIKPEEKIRKEEFKLDVLDDEKFLNLVEFEYDKKDLDELKVGKEDPFELDDLLEVANRNSRR